MNILNVLKKDFSELTTLWKIWLSVGWVIIGITSFYSFNNFTLQFLLNIFAGLSAVTYVVFVAIDNKSSMLFGMMCALSYGIIAFNSKLYGDAMQNIGYQLPILFCGFVNYEKEPNNGKFNLVSVFEKMTKTQSILLYLVSLITYSFVLKYIGDISPMLDAFTTITAMFAVVLLALRSKWQWYLWVSVNLMSSIIWYRIGGLSIMSSMWIFFLMNSFVGFYKNIIKK